MTPGGISSSSPGRYSLLNWRGFSYLIYSPSFPPWLKLGMQFYGGKEREVSDGASVVARIHETLLH